MRRARVLLIGAGTMGGVHAESYTRMPDVDLIGIVDTDLERGQRLAQQYQVTNFVSFIDVPTDSFDLVDVCVPTPFHKEYALAAAKLTKHVICEKPIARTIEDAQEMIQACKNAGVTLLVGHVVRFFPQYVRAKYLVDEGRIGEVAVARTFRGGSFPHAWNDWYSNTDWSGGVLVDLTIHDFDFLRWTFGEVDHVYTKLVDRAKPRLTYSVSTLRFKSGVIAHVEGSWAHTGFTTRFEFAGSGGIIDEDMTKSATLNVSMGETDRPGVAVPLAPVFENPYYLELRHFIDVILERSLPRVTANDGLAALKIALACRRSAQLGEPVAVSS